jgi:hypothetical protein
MEDLQPPSRCVSAEAGATLSAAAEARRAAEEEDEEVCEEKEGAERDSESVLPGEWSVLRGEEKGGHIYIMH